ncbi:hypothetical protein PIB30_005175 [Stylosanthes scabra]|uniref:F-box domain-containing protein n=1 Tax=Stylosanthes scabra TaxID=79078 RepID=A0ABU6R3J6_9FABA|nr:hypothetical protein [Stylosanthes scabra]
MLPFDLIIEILTHLPLATLLRFRSVCKSWNSLITGDLSFALNHLHATSRRRVIFTRLADPYFTDYSLPYAFTSTSASIPAATTRLFPSAAPGSHFHHSIVGSCNGLLCLFTVSRNLLLWNPSTGKFRNLPSLEDQRFSVVTSGFGYDHVSRSYKVVVVLYIKNHEFDSRVHTLGSDSWRRIQHFPLSSTACCPGKFVGGTLNWLDKNRFVVSLNLALEFYQQISLPDLGGNNADEFELTLEVFKNSLCVLSCCSHFIDVWIMKDYGIAESWTKLLCVPDLIYYPEFLGFDFNVPRSTRAICISDEDDEILLELWLDMEQKFVVYNFRDDSFRPAGIEKFGGRVAAEVYVESLISPCLL